MYDLFPTAGLNNGTFFIAPFDKDNYKATGYPVIIGLQSPYNIAGGSNVWGSGR